MVDITISTTHQSSPSIPPTTSENPHDPFQRQQHPPNVSSSPSSSQLQRFVPNSSSSFTNGSSRPHSIERHVTYELLDHRRSSNVPSTPTRAASTTTSCCCPLLLQQLQQRVHDFTDVSSTSQTSPRRPKIFTFTSSRPQRPVNARLDDEPLQHHSNAAADISGTADSIDSRLNIQS